MDRKGHSYKPDPRDLNEAFEVFRPVWERFLAYVVVGSKVSPLGPTLQELRAQMVLAFDLEIRTRERDAAPRAASTEGEPPSPSPAQGHLPSVLTVEETARLLRVGRSAAYEAARRGEIPVIKVGRRLLVPRKRLERLLQEQQTSE